MNQEWVTRKRKDGTAMRSRRTGKPIRYQVPPDKSSLPSGLQQVVTPGRMNVKKGIKEKYSMGTLVMESVDEGLVDWKRERDARRKLSLLMKYEKGSFFQKREAEINLRTNYPQLFKDYKEWRKEKSIEEDINFKRREE